MTTMTTRNSSNNLNLLLFGLAFLLLVLFFVAWFTLGEQIYSHAELKHGSYEAEQARRCLSQKNNVFFSDTRKAIYCYLEDIDKWAVIIVENGKEVTAFLKNKLKRESQVIRYLNNAGYFAK